MTIQNTSLSFTDPSTDKPLSYGRVQVYTDNTASQLAHLEDVDGNELENPQVLNSNGEFGQSIYCEYEYVWVRLYKNNGSVAKPVYVLVAEYYINYGGDSSLVFDQVTIVGSGLQSDPLHVQDLTPVKPQIQGWIDNSIATYSQIVDGNLEALHQTITDERTEVLASYATQAWTQGAFQGRLADTEAVSDISLTGDASTVSITETKTDLATGSEATTSKPMPVADPTHAGVMNSSQASALTQAMIDIAGLKEDVGKFIDNFDTYADMEAYTGTVESGDWCVVEADETHDNKSTRYIWEV